ncbi:MAG: class I SAM-dependent methyltransferase [Thermoplasmata archaeon]
MHRHDHFGKFSEERISMAKKAIEDFKDYISGKVVVDMGSGDGSITKLLSGYALYVYAVDHDEDLLNILKKNCEGIKNVIPTLTESSHISLDDSFAEVVFSANSFHDLPLGYEKEFQRILKKKGYVIIFDWKKVDTPFGPPMDIRLDQIEVKKRFGSLGFSLALEKEYDTHYLLIFKNNK